MDPLSIALAVFGGYQGFRTAKKAHAGLLGQLFGAGLGAFGGSQLGGGITSLGAEMAPSVFGEGTFLGTKINPFASASEANVFNVADTSSLPQAKVQTAPVNANIGNEFQQLNTNVPQITNASFNQSAEPMSAVYDDSNNVLSYKPASTSTTNSGAAFLTKDQYDALSNASANQNKTSPDFFHQFAYNDPSTTILPNGTQINNPGGIAWGRLGLTGGLVGLGAAYKAGAFDPIPKKAMTVGSNTEVPYVEANTPFYVQNPQTGQVSLQQRNPSIEAYNIANPRPGTINLGPYQTQVQQYAQGGLAQFSHFRDGGINYLPSKIATDENNPNNYVRANGYVADSMQAGNKDEDTMLAQLADGEFVTRTDGVLGAGILAGADPTNQNEMRKLGADFFYEQQKRFKRIFDLLDASRKATAH